MLLRVIGLDRSNEDLVLVLAEGTKSDCFDEQVLVN